MEKAATFQGAVHYFILEILRRRAGRRLEVMTDLADASAANASAAVHADAATGVPVTAVAAGLPQIVATQDAGALPWEPAPAVVRGSGGWHKLLFGMLCLQSLRMLMKKKKKEKKSLRMLVVFRRS